MGLLDRFRTGGESAKTGDEKSRSGFELSPDEYSPVFPIAITSDDLQALEDLIELEAETPRIDGPGESLIRESLDEVMADATPDGTTWSESLAEPRERAEAIASAWRAQLRHNPGVVYAPVGLRWRLENFLTVCETRDEMEEDPLEMPDRAAYNTVRLIIERIPEATLDDDTTVAIVNNDVLPDFE
jgi:hypothetical protein